MAIGDAYATVAQYKATKDKTSSADDTALTRDLLSVSRYIDHKTGWVATGFNKDASVVTRVYRSGDDIAPIASTAGLIIKASSAWPVTWGDVDALTVDDDFELLPLNALDEGWPYRSYRLISELDRVQITAIRGWPAVPSGIVSATIELTAMFRGESPYATNRFTEFDQMIGQSVEARRILHDFVMQYARYPIAVG